MIKNGYKIIERNTKNKHGEIDIVAKNKNKLIFVEVRSKIGDKHGIAEDTINQKKIQKIIKNAEIYIKNKKENSQYRIDVIAVCFCSSLLNEKEARINHYKSITSY